MDELDPASTGETSMLAMKTYLESKGLQVSAVSTSPSQLLTGALPAIIHEAIPDPTSPNGFSMHFVVILDVVDSSHVLSFDSDTERQRSTSISYDAAFRDWTGAALLVSEEASNAGGPLMAATKVSGRRSNLVLLVKWVMLPLSPICLGLLTGVLYRRIGRRWVTTESGIQGMRT